jgi:hypothetical protein
VVLPPDDYDLTVLVADPSTAGTGMFRGAVRVPPPSAELRLSDWTWAERVEPLAYKALASYDEPYHVGPYRIVPRLSATFRAGDTLRLFFEIYGGTPPFQVTYRVEGQELDGSWVALGKPASGDPASESQGWELVTSDRWPLGEYRVRIEVADREGRRLEAGAPFRLEGPPSP